MFTKYEVLRIMNFYPSLQRISTVVVCYRLSVVQSHPNEICNDNSIESCHVKYASMNGET
jgi:hypothetical protein